jgi:hypothetical protein
MISAKFTEIGGGGKCGKTKEEFLEESVPEKTGKQKEGTARRRRKGN